jgi:hypothetical protein
VNHDLKPVYDRTVELLHADPRVLAAFMTGSVGTEREDAYSDVDPVFVVAAEDFEALDRDLPGIFAQAGTEPFLWWPERCNCDTLRNYAVLFQVNGKPVQYDITIATVGAIAGWLTRPDQVLFDKADVLHAVVPEQSALHPPARLGWQVEIYWIYAYIHAKYLKRGDPFKIAAAQQELLQAHVAILRALHPEHAPDWWPILSAKFAEPGEREALLSYFGPPDAASVAAKLAAQMARFSEHAKAACAKWDVPYSQAAEDGIRPYVEATARAVSVPL